MAQPTEQASGYRPPLNGDTPAANKVLGRCYEEMKTSEWIQLFEPTPIRQAVWADLSHELAWPVTSTSLDQAVKETVTFLKAMGLQATSRPLPSNIESWAPAEAGAELWKWKKRLRGAFGATAFNMGRRPTLTRQMKQRIHQRYPCRRLPRRLPKTPEAVRAQERSPYFQDSHMVTPKSVNHNEHVRTTADNSGETRRPNRSSGRGSRRRFPLSNDSSDDDDDSNKFTGDGGAQMNEYLRQIREVTETEKQNVTPRIESAESRYYSAKRDDKEHICDYLNRLNGYARNAGIQFENGGRKARDHVQRFLETCGDRGLERRLCHIRAKDIHELKEMIMDILKIDERNSTRESSQHPSRSRDSTRRREERRREDSRDHYSRRDRRDRDYDRRRDDSRNVPRVTLAEASVTDICAELQERDVRSSRGERPRNTQRNIPNSGSEADSDELSDDSRQLSDTRSDGYSSDGSGRYLAAANDNERRAAAEGTYARTDNRGPRGDPANRNFGRNDRYPTRGDREGRPRQYGPCAACGGLSHSAHYYRKRCKLCKQVHDAGRCEVFQEIANVVRSKIDKKDLSPELQSLLFTEHLN
ncbi:unnamed protein product [Phytophthora lilii]|uniref:Unnamed protein product n=1 Tax=Phytophthora lilii TaxID=2077276 RepID=A0A9W7CRJ4_9STRA|nr:unnamed protein product [Phytophthora lilii]